MPSFDSKHNSERSRAYQASIAGTGTVTDDGEIIDTQGANKLTFKVFVSNDGTSEMDLTNAFFEHSDDTNPANFTEIPDVNIIGDKSDYIVNLDNQDILYSAEVGAFNNKRYVRTRLSYERGAGGTVPLYWGIVKQVKLIPASLGG